MEQSECKRPFFKVSDKVIFGLIREAVKGEMPKMKSKEGAKMKQCLTKRRKKEGVFNTGRWSGDEHQRFIEALLKYGNEWKSVQRHVGTRSSTQARSHAQKFFVKIGKTEISNLQLDFENNSLRSLNILANNLDANELSNAIKVLNKIATDKKRLGKKSETESSVEFDGADHDDFPNCLKFDREIILADFPKDEHHLPELASLAPKEYISNIILVYVTKNEERLLKFKENGQ